MGTAADIGRSLREAREGAGRTIEELSGVTRIHATFLTAIEEGSAISLGEVYRKTFVRTYARELGLDPDALIVEEPRAVPPAADAAPRSAFAELPAGPPVEEGVASPVSRNPFAEQSQIRTMAVVVILLVAALVMSVKWLGSEGDRQPAAEERPAGRPETPRGERLQAFARDSAGGDAAGAADSLVLRATTTESVWVHIVIDNDSTIEYTLPPSYSLTLRARDNFLLAVGNPAGLAISLNGRKMDVLGEGNRPRKNIFLSRKSIPE